MVIIRNTIFCLVFLFHLLTFSFANISIHDNLKLDIETNWDVKDNDVQLQRRDPLDISDTDSVGFTVTGTDTNIDINEEEAKLNEKLLACQKENPDSIVFSLDKTTNVISEGNSDFYSITITTNYKGKVFLRNIINNFQNSTISSQILMLTDEDNVNNVVFRSYNNYKDAIIDTSLITSGIDNNNNCIFNQQNEITLRVNLLSLYFDSKEMLTPSLSRSLSNNNVKDYLLAVKYIYPSTGTDASTNNTFNSKIVEYKFYKQQSPSRLDLIINLNNPYYDYYIHLPHSLSFRLDLKNDDQLMYDGQHFTITQIESMPHIPLDLKTGLNYKLNVKNARVNDGIGKYFPHMPTSEEKHLYELLDDPDYLALPLYLNLSGITDEEDSDINFSLLLDVSNPLTNSAQLTFPYELNTGTSFLTPTISIMNEINLVPGTTDKMTVNIFSSAYICNFQYQLTFRVPEFAHFLSCESFGDKSNQNDLVNISKKPSDNNSNTISLLVKVNEESCIADTQNPLSINHDREIVCDFYFPLVSSYSVVDGNPYLIDVKAHLDKSPNENHSSHQKIHLPDSAVDMSKFIPKVDNYVYYNSDHTSGKDEYKGYFSMSFSTPGTYKFNSTNVADFQLEHDSGSCDLNKQEFEYLIVLSDTNDSEIVCNLKYALNDLTENQNYDIYYKEIFSSDESTFTYHSVYSSTTKQFPIKPPELILNVSELDYTVSINYYPAHTIPTNYKLTITLTNTLNRYIYYHNTDCPYTLSNQPLPDDPAHFELSYDHSKSPLLSENTSMNSCIVTITLNTYTSLSKTLQAGFSSSNMYISKEENRKYNTNIHFSDIPVQDGTADYDSRRAIISYKVHSQIKANSQNPLYIADDSNNNEEGDKDNNDSGMYVEYYSLITGRSALKLLTCQMTTNSTDSENQVVYETVTINGLDYYVVGPVNLQTGVESSFDCEFDIDVKYSSTEHLTRYLMYTNDYLLFKKNIPFSSSIHSSQSSQSSQFSLSFEEDEEVSNKLESNKNMIQTIQDTSQSSQQGYIDTVSNNASNMSKLDENSIQKNLNTISDYSVSTRPFTIPINNSTLVTSRIKAPVSILSWTYSNSSDNASIKRQISDAKKFVGKSIKKFGFSLDQVFIVDLQYSNSEKKFTSLKSLSFQQIINHLKTLSNVNIQVQAKFGVAGANFSQENLQTALDNMQKNGSNLDDLSTSAILDDIISQCLAEGNGCGALCAPCTGSEACMSDFDCFSGSCSFGKCTRFDNNEDYPEGNIASVPNISIHNIFVYLSLVFAFIFML